jgi:hypothetical protein
VAVGALPSHTGEKNVGSFSVIKRRPGPCLYCHCCFLFGQHFYTWGQEMSEKLVEIWFGEMEFGKFVIGNNPITDEGEIVLIHNIFEKKRMDPERAEDYANGADYLIPSEFRGDIVFSRTFLRGLAAR